MYDQSIVRRVMNGDAEAYTKMYEDCAPAVYRRAYDLLQEHAQAREAVRKTFLDIYHSVGQLRQPSDFDEWVYRLVNYHAERLKKSDKIWDEPDLKMVWDELRDLVNLDNKVVEDAAKELGTGTRAGEGEEAWQPILFPPDEAGPDENVGAMPWRYDPKKAAPEAKQPGQSAHTARDQTLPAPPLPADAAPHTPTETPDNVSHLPFRSGADGAPAETGDKQPVKTQEELVLPPPPPEFKGLARSGKRSRRVRYESASARSPRYSIERVPYDYLPYDEASQAAYDRIELEESPRAVYEVVPYRYHKNPEGNVAESIPYKGPQRSNVVPIHAPDAPEATTPADLTAGQETASYAVDVTAVSAAATEALPKTKTVDASRIVEVAESELQGATPPDDLADLALQTIETPEAKVAIVEENVLHAPQKKKKRFYADARFFVAVIAILGILVYLGFRFEVLS